MKILCYFRRVLGVTKTKKLAVTVIFPYEKKNPLQHEVPSLFILPAKTF